MATISIAAPTQQRRTASRRPVAGPVARPATPSATRQAARPAARVAAGRPAVAPGIGVRPTLVLERPRPASGAHPLRLTRRGRRLARTLVVLAALVAALVLSVAGRSATSQAGDGAAVPATTTVVVQPGQTLWSVARGLSADADVRETVARIQELNGLSGTAGNTVRPGQQLVVPVVH
jgi:nucleoid-associated protein YgaU